MIEAPDLDIRNMLLDGVRVDIEVREAITSCDFDRSIDGAPTLRVGLHDPGTNILNSGVFSSRVTTQFDQWSFELAGIKKNKSILQLTFEEITAANCRKIDTPRKVEAGVMTRADFIRQLVAEVSPWINFVTIPTTELSKVAMSRGTPYEAPGMDTTGIMSDQITIPGQGTTPGGGGRDRIAAFMDAIAGKESGGNPTARNARTGAYGLFQIMPSNWEPWRIEAGLPPFTPKTAETQFVVARFKMLQYFDLFGGNWAAVAVAWYAGPASAQEWLRNSNQGRFTARFRQREPSINEYVWDVMQRFGSSSANASNAASVNALAAGETDPGKEEVREDTWTATGRLADEVGWVRYVRGPNEFVYVPAGLGTLGPPKHKVGPHTEGVVDLDFDYDVGKNEAVITLKMFAHRWKIPPGDHVYIAGNWPCSGPGWIVTNISRSAFSQIATITITRPQPILPEPEREGLGPNGLEDLLSGRIQIPGNGRSANTQSGSGPEGTFSNFNPGGFAWPTSIHVVTSPFGMRNGRMHNGVDIPVPTGSQIRATKDGVVVRARRETGGFGNVITIQHNDGTKSNYAHLLEFVAMNGAVVKQGDIIAKSGGAQGVSAGAGNSTGAHLHFEILRGQGATGGQPMNPMDFLPQ